MTVVCLIIVASAMRAHIVLPSVCRKASVMIYGLELNEHSYGAMGFRLLTPYTSAGGLVQGSC